MKTKILTTTLLGAARGKDIIAIITLLAITLSPIDRACPQNLAAPTARERLLLDFGWRFAFGHATDPGKDFDPAPASQMFSY